MFFGFPSLSGRSPLWLSLRNSECRTGVYFSRSATLPKDCPYNDIQKTLLWGKRIAVIGLCFPIAHSRLLRTSMKTSHCLCLVWLLALLGGCSAFQPKPPAVAPDLPRNFAVRPYFLLKDGQEMQAGTAFGAKLDNGETVLLSVLHLFGEAGGLSKDIPAAKVPEVVESVTLYDMGYKQKYGEAGKGLLRDGYPLGSRGNEDCSGDLVAFALDGKSGVATLPLAKQNPQVGETVWIVGKVYAHEGPVADRYEGKVESVSAQSIDVELGVPVELTGFSGAPVVNAKGEVVGIVVGGAKLLNYASASLNPIQSIRKYLSRRSERFYGTSTTPPK